MTTVEFLEGACQEFIKAALWYECKECGLVRGDKIILLAIAHGHRKPGYWQSRLPSEIKP